MSRRPTDRDGDKAGKARRDFERLQEQSERLFGAGSAERREPEPEDRIEVLGRRIGRTLGYLIAVGLFIYLLATYVLP